MTSRQEFINEMKVRFAVQKILSERAPMKTQTSVRELQKDTESEEIIRGVIRTLIEGRLSPVPHQHTGINVLADVLRKVIPVIRDDFKSLTTDATQRRSFRAHIINGIKNSLAPVKNIFLSDTKGIDPTQELNEDAEDEQDINVDVGEDTDNIEREEPEDPTKDKFIDIEPSQEVDPEQEKLDTFAVEGEDSTGRNIALRTFNKVEKQIVDSYTLLDNEKDRDLFYDYAITNLKLYFDRWEDELKNQTEDKSPLDTKQPV